MVKETAIHPQSWDEAPNSSRWANIIKEQAADWGDTLIAPEWEDKDGFRTRNGWMGKDLVHDVDAPVHIFQYFAKHGDGNGIEGRCKGGVGTTLTGIVHFTPRAESHAGLCHGGSICSVLDDAMGWCGFLATGECKPWSGFTAKVNARLKKPVETGSTLLVQAKITRMEGRLVFMKATLVAPGNDGKDVCHAKGDGLVVLDEGVVLAGPVATASL